MHWKTRPLQSRGETDARGARRAGHSARSDAGQGKLTASPPQAIAYVLIQSPTAAAGIAAKIKYYSFRAIVITHTCCKCAPHDRMEPLPAAAGTWTLTSGLDFGGFFGRRTQKEP
jgi:hypothetical protein